MTTGRCLIGRQKIGGVHSITRADLHRQATWPASQFRSSSVSRAKCLPGGVRSAQTLGVMNPRLAKVVRVMVAGIAVAIVGVLIFGHRTTSMALAPLALPGDVRLWVELKPTHPFLAEYDRILFITRGQTEVRQMLFPDTGGYGRLNIYVQNRNSVVVKGPFDEFVIHIDSLQVEKPPKPLAAPGQYLAAFAKDSEGTWRFILVTEADEVSVEAPQ